jgi:tetratricopeptide (TPR) repeat protein
MSDISPTLLPEGILEAGAQGLPARALLGWMDKEQAVKFLMEDCAFNTPLTRGTAEAVWESRKAIVENLPREEPLPLAKLPLSAADLKAARKFRSRHEDANFLIDFVRLNPMDLVVHQLWVSTAIADGYREKVTPDKWLRTALLDPASESRLKWRRDGNTIIFDLPRFQYVLMGPLAPDGHMRVSETLDFVTVAFHANRALLISGYHRTFAAAQYCLEAPNAPRGILFGVSNYLALMGSEADDVLNLMEEPRPPRMADFFDPRLFLPVTLRKRRYEMRVSSEVTESDEQEAETSDTQSPAIAASALAQTGLRSFGQGGRSIFDDAVRHHQAGRLDEAIAGYERGLFLKPDHAGAHNNLGLAFVAQGRIDDAAEQFERALALEPGFVDAHQNMGTVLAEQGNYDGAIEHLTRVLNINRDSADVHHYLGDAFACQGKFEDAIAHYGRAIAIRPDFAEVHHDRAQIRTFRRGDADLAALEALAGSNGLSADKVTFIHFALAKALDDIGDYTRAFEHLHKGNALKRREINYDEVAECELVRQTATAFDRRLFDRLGGGGDPSLVPVFVLGMPRSGSTLIEQILASHPQIHGAGELGYIEAAVGAILNAGRPPVQIPECVPRFDGVGLRRIGQSYLARLRALAPGKSRIVDKTPANAFNIGLIRLILPNARIIHVVRDPIDTCVSCYSKLFTSGQYFSYDLAELGRYYCRYKELMTHWRSVLPPDAVFDVCYEEVVDDIEGQARRLIDYCGLPWDDRCINFHRNSRPVKTASRVQVRQPLFRSSLQRWRSYEVGIGPLLNELEGMTADYPPVDAVGLQERVSCPVRTAGA